MKIQLSDHFTYKKLYRFVLPSIIMMIFTSIYTVVDGFFVSNFAGKTDFAALNLIFPVLMILGAFGFMLGSGGSALVSKTFGEGDAERANRYFSLITYTTVIVGTVISVIALFFIRPISKQLGAEGQTLESCVLYGSIMIVAMPAFMLQNMFQSFFVTAEKPKIGLAVMIAAGFTNIIGDAVLVWLCDFGLAGAAAASALGQLIGGVLPVFYFARKNGSILKLGKTKSEWKVLGKVCTNGSSELLSNLSASIVNMLYNFQLMKIIGEDGIAAFGVMMYVQFVFAAIFIGFSMGSAPLIGFNFSANKKDELKNLFKKSMVTINVCGVVMTALAILLSRRLSYLFVSYDEDLRRLTEHGFIIFAFCFLFCGMNIFGSAFFTALNNGLVSAVISFLRTMVFQIAAVMLLPEIINPPVDGIWFSVSAAEIASVIITVIFLIFMNGRYGYAGKEKPPVSQIN